MTHDVDTDDPKFDYEDPSVSSAANRLLWTGSPGQIVNMGTFILCTAAIVLLWTFMPGMLALYGSVAIGLLAGVEFARTHRTRYELTTERLTKRWGLMSPAMSRVPLYRIEDSGTVSPLLMRLFGRGVVRVISSDPSDSMLVLVAVPNPESLEDLLRNSYERARGRRGTRVID